MKMDIQSHPKIINLSFEKDEQLIKEFPGMVENAPGGIELVEDSSDTDISDDEDQPDGASDDDISTYRAIR
jgi:hypothetical protein